jgi:hypothetical protein
MRYLLLIYGSEDVPDPTPDEQGAVMAAYNAFTEHIRSKNAYLGGEALEPTATATTVRVRDGRTLTTDGPFAETMEALGGYYLVEAKDLDEAIDFAARIPGAQNGSIEVRPIWEIPAEYLAGAEAAAAN